VTYTQLALLAVTATVLLDLAVLRTRLLTRKAFWTAYAIVVSFQLLTNAWLTGRGIVTYDERRILGLRVAYAPVEDLLFGFALVTQSMVWWVWWGRRGVQRDRVQRDRVQRDRVQRDSRQPGG
jgi:lycopene cyclase domain-containing protein